MIHGQARARWAVFPLTLLLVLSMTAIGQSANLPVLAGDTTLTTVGPRTMIVSLPRSITVDFRDVRTWITVATSGSYGGIMIEELSPHRRPHGQLLLFAPASPPAGCPAPDAVFSPGCEHKAVGALRMHGAPQYLPSKMTLERGTLRLYLLSDPGKAATVRLRLSGLAGRTRLTATKPLNAIARIGYINPVGGSGHMQGRWTARLARPGKLIGYTWTTGMKVSYDNPLTTWNDWIYSKESHGSLCFAPASETDPTDTCNTPTRLTSSDSPPEDQYPAGDWTAHFNFTGISSPGSQMGAMALWLPWAT